MRREFVSYMHRRLRIYSKAYFKTMRFVLISFIALLRLEAYFLNKSCCRPDQTTCSEPSTFAVTVTLIGYLSTLLLLISAPGKTASTQLFAVSNSWRPPSQLRLCRRSLKKNFAEVRVRYHSSRQKHDYFKKIPSAVHKIFMIRNTYVQR